jgi:hypothetical protein
VESQLGRTLRIIVESGAMAIEHGVTHLHMRLHEHPFFMGRLSSQLLLLLRREV